MFNIITLVSLLITTLAPQGLRSAYLREYDLVGEIPDITISSTAEETTSPILVMPEIVITAPRPRANDRGIEFPEIVISASYINPSENMTGIIMMPEIVVTARRTQSENVGMTPIKQKAEKGG